MQHDKVNNTRIASEELLITPKQLIEKLPLSVKAQQFVAQARSTIADICHHRDSRLLVIVGPCSIHDVEQAKEYATRLKELHDKYQDRLYIVMRVYFEKPRTTVGWKGLINDPHMDNSFDVAFGLQQARELLTWIAELGLPAATEALDPMSPQYISDLISWAAIGARTTESQTHREMASGLSMPVGFKNGTDGSLSTAINGMQSAASSHRFIGMSSQGETAIMQTAGNPDCHVILRGGKQPNYDSVHVALAEQEMQKAKLTPSLMVDCSHANSNKNHELQPLVAENVIHQIQEGNRSIMGIMLESNLEAGNQSSDLPREQLRYGVSVTDACIDWASTAQLLNKCYDDLGQSLAARK